MSTLGKVYASTCNLAYLAGSKLSLRNKIKILFFWLKINTKFLIFAKLFKIKTERFLGYKLDAFNYETIRYLFDEIFFRNEYIFDTENKKPIIFDCGANVGFATIYFKWLYPESEIYAFEPDKRTFEVLKKNILQNKLDKVYLFNVAISNRDGKIDFFIDLKNPGSVVMSTKRERTLKDKITVDCISLSSLIKNKNIPKIDLVKMDIEGSEKEVIEDLNNTNQLAKVMKLVIEYHHKIIGYKSNLSEFLKFFEKNGFEYQMDTRCIPTNSENRFQNILLYLYKESKK